MWFMVLQLQWCKLYLNLDFFRTLWFFSFLLIIFCEFKFFIILFYCLLMGKREKQNCRVGKDLFIDVYCINIYLVSFYFTLGIILGIEEIDMISYFFI